ncbi:MBL fold metallo-hydrolase [Steroidobacter sp.]|uniref:MBL fold metallo-hydrolase n=1 Tax=Steroidobacter sp. TaxID=1978227 RepID=UPI001A4893FF|nr:MBL fold metallo-hydrolase [Steroidobacter sp.]MBL8265268.1 MBL fold metallo-hydrolase [Steroidobacter sp.]
MKWAVVASWLSLVALIQSLAAAEAFGPLSPPPHRIAGNLYNVGSKGHNSFLITTAAGHFLIDSGFDPKLLDRGDEQVGPKEIQEHIVALGFEPRDIKFLLCTHSHMDHVGGHAEMRRATGAQVMVMAGDDASVRAGEAGADSTWTPSPVDRVLQDGDELTLGGTSLRAHRTPGHTKGATTWTFQVVEDGRKRDVVLLDSAWFWFESDAEYPDRGSDYLRTLQLVKALPCDILLDPHGYYYQRMRVPASAGEAQESSNPFVDAQGCSRFIADKQAELLEHLRKERSAPE